MFNYVKGQRIEHVGSSTVALFDRQLSKGRIQVMLPTCDRQFIKVPWFTVECRPALDTSKVLEGVQAISEYANSMTTQLTNTGLYLSQPEENLPVEVNEELEGKTVLYDFIKDDEVEDLKAKATFYDEDKPEVPTDPERVSYDPDRNILEIIQRAPKGLSEGLLDYVDVGDNSERLNSIVTSEEKYIYFKFEHYPTQVLSTVFGRTYSAIASTKYLIRQKFGLPKRPVKSTGVEQQIEYYNLIDLQLKPDYWTQEHDVYFEDLFEEVTNILKKRERRLSIKHIEFKREQLNSQNAQSVS